MKKQKLSCYLAGPDVFRKDAKKFFQAMKKKVKAAGFEPLCPLDNEIKGTNKAFVAQKIYKANIKMIEKSDIVLANISCFRGPSCDVGTAFEIGYAKALGKNVYCYVYDSISWEYKNKVCLFDKLPEDSIKDSLGRSIEDFGLVDNLMIASDREFVFNNLEQALVAIKEDRDWL